MYIGIRINLRYIIFGFLLLFSFCAHSSDVTPSGNSISLNAGQTAFNAGDYSKALNIWLDLANKGQSEAQVFVGLAYANGWGIEKDKGHAAHWYRIAADNNNSSAQFLLGLHYLNSENTQLEPLAVYWLKKAAKNGEPSAINFLKKAKTHNWFSVAHDLTIAETEPSEELAEVAKLSNVLEFDMPISTEISSANQL